MLSGLVLSLTCVCMGKVNKMQDYANGLWNIICFVVIATKFLRVVTHLYFIYYCRTVYF